MKSERVTATEFLNATGKFFDAAKKAPVVITKHGRNALVVMDYDEYERLKSYDTREWLRPSELDDDLAAELRTAEMDPRHAHLDKLVD